MMSEEFGANTNHDTYGLYIKIDSVVECLSFRVEIHIGLLY
jgi:hypothetical protein